MLARQGRSGQRERHAILKLVAESVRAAGLVKCRSRPHAADQRLIEHPAIEDDVQGAVRRCHLHLAEHVIPVLNHRAQQRIEIERAVTDQQRLCVGESCGLTEEKDHLDGLVQRKFDESLQGAAGVESSPHPPGQGCPAVKRCRPIERAISSEKLATVGVQRVWFPARSANATCPNMVFQGLRANIAPVAGSIVVTMYGAVAAREVPSTHSTYAVTESLRAF